MKIDGTFLNCWYKYIYIRISAVNANFLWFLNCIYKCMTLMLNICILTRNIFVNFNEIIKYWIDVCTDSQIPRHCKHLAQMTEWRGEVVYLLSRIEGWFPSKFCAALMVVSVLSWPTKLSYFSSLTSTNNLTKRYINMLIINVVYMYLIVAIEMT